MNDNLIVIIINHKILRTYFLPSALPESSHLEYKIDIEIEIKEEYSTATIPI